MKGSEHLLFGIGAGVLTAYCFHATIAAPGPVVFGCALGSLYPDIDLATSKLGHRVKPVAIAVNKLFGHRNFVHSPINCALITALVYLLVSYLDPGNASAFSSGFMLGFLGHLLQDMCTRTGIPLLSPIVRKRQHILPLSSDNPLCWAVTILLLVGYYFLCRYLTWPFIPELK